VPKELLVARTRWVEKWELLIGCQMMNPIMQELPRAIPAQQLQVKGQRGDPQK